MTKVGFQAQVEHANATIETMYEGAREQVKRIREQAIRDMPGLWNSMCSILGVKVDSEAYVIQSAIGNLRDQRDEKTKIAFGRALDMLQRIIDNHRSYTKVEEEPDDEEETQPTVNNG